MRTIRSGQLDLRTNQPSSPPTRATVPMEAVNMAHRLPAMVAVGSAPMRRMGLSRKKKGIRKPTRPRRTDSRPVLVWLEPAMPAAT